MITVREAFEQLCVVMPGKNFKLSVEIWRFVHPVARGAFKEEIQLTFKWFDPDMKASMEDTNLDNLLMRVVQYVSTEKATFPMPKPLVDLEDATSRLPHPGERP